MSGWTRIASVEEIPPGKAKEVASGGRVIALFNVDGEIHAMDGICPHAGGPLGAGPLDGQIVTCPWHGWRFDVTTGQHSLNSRLRQERFPVKVEGSNILVQLPEAASD